jgi:hypothetical protein
MQYYIYRHIRLDNNETFYIGVGTKQLKKIKGYRTEYSRAYERSKRTSFWKSVVKKTDYKVEILFESDDKELINQKEKELIALYGRRCLNTGTLVNFAEGGDSLSGPRNRNIKVLQMSMLDEPIKLWNQLKDIENELKYLKTNIVKCCRKKALSAYGFKWKYLNNSEFDDVYASTKRTNSTNRAGIVVLDTTTGNESTYRTIGEVAKAYGYHRSTIFKYLNQKSKHQFLVMRYRNWIELNPVEATSMGFRKSKTI